MSVKIQIVRRFPVPVDRAYAWLTDFEDDDVQRAGAVIQMRRVIVREPGRVVYEGETAMLGVRAPATTEVTFEPPSRWRARVTHGPRTGSVVEYELTPEAGATRLQVTYHFVIRPAFRMVLLRVLRPLVKRELSRMWDGFEAALRQDLSAPSAAAAAQRS